jgi:hypothetical protein
MADISAEDLIAYRDDPVKMVEDLFGAVPDPRQEVVLRAFPPSPRLAIQAAAGVGTTACLAWLAWNFMLTREDDCEIGVTASTSHLLHELWNELKKWYDVSDVLKNRFEFRRASIRSLMHQENVAIKVSLSGASTADEINDRLRGLIGGHVMWVVDHAESVPDFAYPALNSIFSGEPVDAHILIGGTPHGEDSLLYRATLMKDDPLTVMKITANPDDPFCSPFVLNSYTQQQIEQYGRDCPWVINNIFGEFFSYPKNTGK